MTEQESKKEEKNVIEPKVEQATNTEVLEAAPESTKLTFENEKLEVLAELSPGCQVQMTINLDLKFSKSIYQDAIKVIGKKVVIPGFRKGRAPNNIILENYKSYVNDEWGQLLLSSPYAEALKLAQLFPIAEDSVKNVKLQKTSPENPVSISFNFESFPVVPDFDFNSLTIKKILPAPITEEKIDKELDAVRHFNAKWEEIKDRNVEKDDFIEVDITNIEEPPQVLEKGLKVKVADDEMGEWMQKLVLGAAINDEVEGVSEPTLDAEGKPPEGFIATPCKIKILKILHCELPELTDEFAQKSGSDSLEDLRKKSELALTSAAEKLALIDMEEIVGKTVVEKINFDIPKSILDKEILIRLNKKQQSLAEQDLPKEKIAEFQPKIEEQAKEEALAFLKLWFIAQKLHQKHEFNITQQEFLQEMTRQMYDSSKDESILEKSMDPKEIQDRVYMYMLSKKAKQELMKSVTFE